MSKRDANQAVRPLDEDGREPKHHERRPPQLGLVILLLVAGGLVGWVVASLGATDNTIQEVENSDVAGLGPTSLEPGPVAEVQWIRATVVPETPDGLEYSGVSAVAEVDGSLYVAVNWMDPDTHEVTGELWSSADGLEWQAEPIDIGIPVATYDLTATGNGLLLAARSPDTDSLWRSTPARAIGGSSWSEVPLEIPTTIVRDSFMTAATSDGDIMVIMVGHLDILDRVIEPYLPAGVSLDDENYTYNGDQFIYTQLPPSSIQIFGEHPEVVVAGDNVWIRLVTLEGEEILRTIPLPDGAYPTTTEQGSVLNVTLLMAWVSTDGVEFRQVLSKDALPEGLFNVEAWEEGFVGATHEPRRSSVGPHDVTLWESESGRSWSPQPQQPPGQCLPFHLAVSEGRILLTTPDGTQCVGDRGSEWAVLDEPSTATYVVGGPAGFIGYPDAFSYDAAMFSQDGLAWAKIEIPALEPYPSLSILEDRLLVVSVGRSRPNNPVRIGIWVGQPDT